MNTQSSLFSISGLVYSIISTDVTSQIILHLCLCFCRSTSSIRKESPNSSKDLTMFWPEIFCLSLVMSPGHCRDDIWILSARGGGAWVHSQYCIMREPESQQWSSQSRADQHRPSWKEEGGGRDQQRTYLISFYTQGRRHGGQAGCLLSSTHSSSSYNESLNGPGHEFFWYKKLFKFELTSVTGLCPWLHAGFWRLYRTFGFNILHGLNSGTPPGPRGTNRNLKLEIFLILTQML